MRYHPIPSRKQLSSHQACTGNFRCWQEPAVFLYFEADRNDFWAIFVTKSQFRIRKEKHNTSNGVSSHVPSCTAIYRDTACHT